MMLLASQYRPGPEEQAIDDKSAVQNLILCNTVRTCTRAFPDGIKCSWNTCISMESMCIHCGSFAKIMVDNGDSLLEVTQMLISHWRWALWLPYLQTHLSSPLKEGWVPKGQQAQGKSCRMSWWWLQGLQCSHFPATLCYSPFVFHSNHGAPYQLRAITPSAPHQFCGLPAIEGIHHWSSGRTWRRIWSGHNACLDLMSQWQMMFYCQPLQVMQNTATGDSAKSMLWPWIVLCNKSWSMTMHGCLCD